MYRIYLLVFVLVSVLAFGAGPASGQSDKKEALPVPELQRRPVRGTAHTIVDLRRRLEELDRQLMLRNVARAEDLLKDLSQHSALQRELITREILLAQLQGNHEQAILLCRETLIQQTLNPTLWRYLAYSELSVGNVDGAREAVGHFIATNANTRSASVVGVELFRTRGHQEVAVALIDSMRVALHEPHFLGRSRAIGLLVLGNQKEAAAEVSQELRGNPFNLSLLRTELLEGRYDPERHAEFLRICKERSLEATSNPAEVLLVVNLELAGGNDTTALELVRNLLENPKTAVTVLGNVSPLVRELDLLAEGKESKATNRYLLGVLETMATDPAISLNLRKRSARYLALAAIVAMDSGLLGSSATETIDEMGRYLEIVRSVDPTSEQLYSSQIKMVQFTRDHLGQPAVAARRLESMLMDLNLPSEGVALVRLTLGECYLAAGDTSRGRTVLTSLGRDPDFHTAGGHAHFHLARLDLSEGYFATARDRLAVVAMDNPAAPYANEALALGLAIAEEMENPSGGPEVLALYSKAIYFDLIAQPDKRRTALEHFVRMGNSTLDLEEPQHLLERGHWELAELFAEEKNYQAAIAELKQIYTLHPSGRYPGKSLAKQGELYMVMGQYGKARDVYQQLLVQYPDYLFIDDVRDQLRSLP